MAYRVILHLRISAAHALASTGDPQQAVTVLTAIFDSKESMHVRLQALDALTLIGEPSRAALSSLRRAAAAPSPPKASGVDDYIGIASRYLVAVLDGSYRPDAPIFGSWPPIRFPPPRL